VKKWIGEVNRTPRALISGEDSKGVLVVRKILQQGNVYYLDIFVNEIVSSRFYDLGSAAFV
jgi:hypothetical protein